MKKISEMSLDELGVTCLEIEERVRALESLDDGPLKRQQLYHAKGELLDVGKSLRDAFTRYN